MRERPSVGFPILKMQVKAGFSIQRVSWPPVVDPASETGPEIGNDLRKQSVSRLVSRLAGAVGARSASADVRSQFVMMTPFALTGWSVSEEPRGGALPASGVDRFSGCAPFVERFCGGASSVP